MNKVLFIVAYLSAAIGMYLKVGLPDVLMFTGLAVTVYTLLRIAGEANERK